MMKWAQIDFTGYGRNRKIFVTLHFEDFRLVLYVEQVGHRTPSGDYTLEFGDTRRRSTYDESWEDLVGTVLTDLNVLEHSIVMADYAGMIGPIERAAQEAAPHLDPEEEDQLQHWPSQVLVRTVMALCSEVEVTVKGSDLSFRDQAILDRIVIDADA